MEAAASSVRVFDGTTDFRVWRARVENELMRYHLLGYVMVRGYDGSQSFTFNGEQVPPRMPIVHVDDEAVVKEEASCARAAPASQQGRLSRWDVLGESAEAKSILQRFLHPDVECAILNKNIYDSWKILCALYGNRSTPGAHDVYEMHRVLHHIRLGDKKGEPVREFITRWEMLMQQYALATGIELTEGFRSVSLVQTLPSAWRLMVVNWRGVRPFVPYAELVEKVIATRERMLIEATAAVTATAAAASNNASTDRQSAQAAEKSTAKPAAVQPVAKPLANTAASKLAVKSPRRPAEKRAPEAPSSDKATKPSKPVPPPIDVHATATNTVDLTSGDVSSGSSPGMGRALTNSRERATKSLPQRSDKSATPRTSKSPRIEGEKENDSAYEKRERYLKYDSGRSYDKYASYEHNTPHSRYEKKHESYERFDSKGPVSCFYCLKVGHHMKRCWFLQADIENGTTHDPRRKFSCTVTLDRSSYMVNCLEAYIEEMKRERARYGGSSSATTTPRSHRDYEVSESAGRTYKPQQKEFVPPLPLGQPSAYAYREQPSASSTDYHKRSHSVFQPAEGRLSSRDPRLNRSRSVYRSTDIAEDFSPRKRARAPSFEKQLQSYY